ncbi:TetR-like C-terminal domain-containing protein [Streptomyces sp. NPDC001617]
MVSKPAPDANRRSEKSRRAIHDAALALVAEGVVNEQLGRECVAKLIGPASQLYVDRLRAAGAAGELRPDLDPRIALEPFVSPLAQRWLQHTGPISYDYTDTLVVDYAPHGLAPR